MWLLEIELRTSGRAGSALNYGAISPGLLPHFLHALLPLGLSGGYCDFALPLPSFLSVWLPCLISACLDIGQLALY